MNTPTYGGKGTTMSWILDVLVIAIFIGTIIYYARKGFVKSVLGFGRTLISAILSWLLGPKLAAVIAEKVIGNAIAQKVYGLLTSAYDTSMETFDLSLLFEQAPEGFVKTVERFGGDFAELKTKYGDMTAATEDNLMELSRSIAAPITTILSNLFGYLLIFIAAYLLFIIFAGIISKIFELPLLRQINQFLGFLLGIAFGVLNTVIFCFLGAHVLHLLAAFTARFVAEDLIAGSQLFQVIASIHFF